MWSSWILTASKRQSFTLSSLLISASQHLSILSSPFYHQDSPRRSVHWGWVGTRGKDNGQKESECQWFEKKQRDHSQCCGLLEYLQIPTKVCSGLLEATFIWQMCLRPDINIKWVMCKDVQNIPHPLSYLEFSNLSNIFMVSAKLILIKMTCLFFPLASFVICSPLYSSFEHKFVWLARHKCAEVDFESIILLLINFISSPTTLFAVAKSGKNVFIYTLRL